MEVSDFLVTVVFLLVVDLFVFFAVVFFAELVDFLVVVLGFLVVVDFVVVFGFVVVCFFSLVDGFFAVVLAGVFFSVSFFGFSSFLVSGPFPSSDVIKVLPLFIVIAALIFFCITNR